MSKIKVMSANLANKIAAGEVVERVSSVIKELVENSIDAKSRTIKVELLDAGKKSIRVVDDGVGMDKNDAEMCFLRHATSKIYKDDDLFFINTLGFRGEALPSIAAVSDVVLETYNGEEGTMIHIKGGEIIEEGSSTSRTGTIMTVTNLFYNTPARLKYLKSEPSELASVVMYLEKLALSHPEINFTLTNNGGKIISTSGSGNLLKTIHEIYGLDVSSNMIEISGSNDDYEVKGFISKPSVLRSNKNHMTTIINGRIVKNFEINKMINEAYYTYKPDTLYPIVILNINTDPTLIDVNIHPTKQDIKFSKSDELKKLIISLIKDALYKTMLIPNAIGSSINEEDEECEEGENIEYSLEDKLPQSLFVSEPKVKYTTSTFDSNEQKEKQSSIDFKIDSKNEAIKKLELYPIGIAFGTYIIAQNSEGIFLIDQHAAQERVNYEKVLKGIITKNSINLIVPLTIELPASDFLTIKNNIDKLENIGFEMEEFGINTFKINAHPTWIKEGREDETIKEVFDCLISEEKNFDVLRFNDKVAATIACKASIKGNMRITLDEASFLLEELVLCDNPFNCPHGRPTIIKFTIYELEKMFKRAM